MKKNILYIMKAGIVCLLFSTNAIAQSLPADTSLSGLYNAIKSEVEAPRMELMLNQMLKKPDDGMNQMLLDAGAQHTAIAYAEAGNTEKAKYWIRQIKDQSWKNNSWSAVIGTLIEAGKLDKAEQMIIPLIDEKGSASFSGEEKQQLKFQLGVIRFKQGKYKESLPYLAAGQGGGSSAYPELYTLALIRTGNPDLALTEANKLLRGKYVHLSPDFKTELGKLYLKKYGSEQRFKTVLDSIAAVQTKEIQAKVEKMKVNQPAPDFEIKDVNGKTVSLKSLKGKTVFIDFWATWCIPCVGSFPGMQKAVDYYKGDDSVVFMFVHTSEKKGASATEDAMKIVNSKHYTFNVYMDLKDPLSNQNPMSSAFRVSSLPTKLVIDKEGIIRFRTVGFIGVDEAIPEIKTMIDMSRR
ncbi:redoxin domain-containing protein [Pedobacter sp. AW31-3R]|uniref:redoxin domain-containing protein n=1 Tax=Pedobacter sp. AW31-3R TaxID=3445781 RepID=UPI003FA1710D